MRAARGLTLAAILAASAAVAIPAPASASTRTVTATTADHWGSFFGDSNPADRDLTLSPATFTFPAPVVQVGTSNSTQYALLADGTLWAWGQGTNGQLGNGGFANSFTSPVRVQFPPGVTIAFLATDAMPYDGALAVDATGHAWGWGLNKGGENCLGTTAPSDVPVEITSLPGPVTALAGADEHATYVANGTVYACGWDSNGVLGNGKISGSHATPVQVKGLAGLTVTAVYQSQDDAGALTSGGQFYDWGANQWGQLGNGTPTASSDVPVAVSLPGPVAQAAQGGSAPTNGQVLVMLTSGALYGWGNDASSQLGDGGTANQSSPLPFSPPAGVTYSVLASGGATSYAIDTSGNVWAWGNGSAGQIGNGLRVTEKTPVEVDSGAGVISSTAKDVAVTVASHEHRQPVGR